MASADLEGLLRWEGAGGAWQLVSLRAGCVELDLLTCGRDEVMGHVRSGEGDLIEYVEQHDPGDA